VTAVDPSAVVARFLELLARPDRDVALVELLRFLNVDVAPGLTVLELVDVTDVLGLVVGPDDTRTGLVAAITVELVRLAGFRPGGGS
jgi:hypothetical protein